MKLKKVFWTFVWFGGALSLASNISCSSDDENFECACTSTITKYPNGILEDPSETLTVSLDDECHLDGEVYNSTNNRLLTDLQEIQFYSEAGPYEITEVVCN